MDPKTNTIVRDGGAAVINPFDAAALEIALRIKDKLAIEGEPCRVTVLSMGIPATADCCCATASRAARTMDCCCTTAPLPARIPLRLLMRCRAVSQAGRTRSRLCGKMAVDGDTAQIGPELAGPWVAVRGGRGRAPAGGTACARDGRTRGRRRQASLEVPLPAVLTVSKDVAHLRFPSIAGIMAAEGASSTCDGSRREAVRGGCAPYRFGGSPTQVVRSFCSRSRRPRRDRSGRCRRAGMRLGPAD